MISRTLLRFVACFTVFAGIVTDVSAQTAPADPVLVVHGACGSSNEGDCTAAVSRRELDDLAGILAPGTEATPDVRRHLAKSYADVLAFSNAAKELGLDQSSEYQTTMRWLQAKTLADLLRRRLESESSRVTDAEIGEYYRRRLPQFQVVSLRRLVLPKNNFRAEDRQKFEQLAERTACGLRERVRAGEDLDRLQREGFQALGLSGLPPSTEVGTRRRSELPPEVSEEIFSLGPRDVSKVENEPYSFVIYRIDSKWTLAQEQVREEIVHEVAKQKLEHALKSITGNIRMDWNDKYFGTGEDTVR